MHDLRVANENMTFLIEEKQNIPDIMAAKISVPDLFFIFLAHIYTGYMLPTIPVLVPMETRTEMVINKKIR